MEEGGGYKKYIAQRGDSHVVFVLCDNNSNPSLCPFVEESVVFSSVPSVSRSKLTCKDWLVFAC